MVFFCCVVSVLFGPTVSVFVHCTIPESMEACFLVVLGGGGGGVLLGRGGGPGCERTQEEQNCEISTFSQVKKTTWCTGLKAAITFKMTDRSCNTRTNSRISLPNI